MSNWYVKKTGVLCHHGIMGQKWGVRRYQNPDGSLTAAGRKRYIISEKKGGGFTKKAYKEFVRGASAESVNREKTIPKGTKVYRITEPGEKPKDALYVVKNEDRQNIKSIAPYLAMKRHTSPDKLVEKEYTINTDIKIPSQEKVSSISYDILMKNPKLTDAVSLNLGFAMGAGSQASGPNTRSRKGSDYANKTLDECVKMTADDFVRDYAHYLKVDVADLSANQKNYAALIGVNAGVKLYEGYKFCYSNMARKFTGNEYDSKYAEKLIADAIGSSDEFRGKLVKELSAQGYSGMRDNNMIAFGTSYGQEAHEPLIIFSKDSITESPSEKKITNYDVAKAEMEYQKYRAAMRANK